MQAVCPGCLSNNAFPFSLLRFSVGMVLFQLFCGSIAHPYLTAAMVQDASVLTPAGIAVEMVMAEHVLWPDLVETHLSLEFRQLVDGFLDRLMRSGLPEVGECELAADVEFCSALTQCH